MGNSSHLHPVPEPQENIENRAIGILQREAEAFACATQVPCRAVDSRGNFIGGDSIESSCRLCFQSADSGESAISTCASVLKEGIRQSERFGGAYMSFCPHSLLITVAIVRNEAMSVGALVMGPALLVDREELITEELARNTDSDQASFGRMTNILETMPSLDTRRAKALADMLENAASHCSDNFEGRLDPKIEASKRNAKIAEYIQNLKAQGFDATGDKAYLSEYPFDKERILIHYVTTGNRTGARRLLNEILGDVFFSGGGEIRGVQTRALELVVLLSRAAVEGGATAQEVFGANEDFIRHIYSSRTIEDIASWLASVLNRFIDLVFAFKPAKHAEILRKAERFIKEHYREDITLQAVADEVELSASYFSTIFKEETGKGFTTFLNDLRVSKAKELLRDFSIPISEISSVVGFVDQSYFSRVFKAIAGVSPAVYRKSAFAPEAGIEIHEDTK